MSKEFYCHGEFQDLKEYINKKDNKKYLIGRCRKCKKHFVSVDGIELEGKTAKRVYKKVKEKIKQNTEKFDKYRTKTFINDDYTYFITCQKRVKEDNQFRLVQYQAEKRYNSGYSTGFKTLKEKIQAS